MNDLDLVAAYIANGGKVTRIAQGKRALRESHMRDIAHGDDTERATAIDRLADLWERKSARKAYRKARRAVNRALDAKAKG